MTKTLTGSDREYFSRMYDGEVESTIKELREACKKTGDLYGSLMIKIQEKEHYLDNYDYSEPNFNAWSDKYVYVRGKYDGYTWVVGIPRNVSDELTEPIGGG